MKQCEFDYDDRSKWLPTTLEGKLARLTEECGEVLQYLGKIGRFGIDGRYCYKRRVRDDNDKTIESNREGLVREMMDLKSSIEEVIKAL